MAGFRLVQNSFLKGFAALSGAVLLAGLPMPAAAQTDARLERIEAQLRALQRQVFPGGDQRFFEPEITPEAQRSPSLSDLSGNASALTDVLARLDALESQLTRLTAATEVNQNALAALETRIAGLELLSAQARPAAPAPTAAAPAVAAGTTASTSNPITSAAAPASAAGPSAERLAAVRAIVKPATSDAGDDEYVYGFRLWQAGFFPEAQQQLTLFLERYPNHPRVTYGRNLLGRALLDAGDPEAASRQFYQNYMANQQADRAPDSLLFLAESRIQLNDTRRACIALAEFGEGYPALATGRLQAQYDALVGRVDCD